MEVDFNNVVTFINGVGFPIAICVYLLWYERRVIEKQQTLLIELKDTISDNSEVMRAIVDELKRGK